MNAREILAARELKARMIAAFPKCAVCGEEPSTQIAHRLGQGKANMQRYGAAIIHHPYNLVPVCGLDCNSKVVIDHKPVRVADLQLLTARDSKMNAGDVKCYAEDFVAPLVIGWVYEHETRGDLA